MAASIWCASTCSRRTTKTIFAHMGDASYALDGPDKKRSPEKIDERLGNHLAAVLKSRPAPGHRHNQGDIAHRAASLPAQTSATPSWAFSRMVQRETPQPLPQCA